jgi:hypothetical protein
LDTSAEVVLLEEFGALVTNSVLEVRSSFVVLYTGRLNFECGVVLVSSTPVKVLTVVPTFEEKNPDCVVIFANSGPVEASPDET